MEVIGAILFGTWPLISRLQLQPASEQVFSQNHQWILQLPTVLYQLHVKQRINFDVYVAYGIWHKHVINHPSSNTPTPEKKTPMDTTQVLGTWCTWLSINHF